MIQATKGLAAEYGPHQIRVNSLCPLLSGTGLFETFTGMEDTPENREKFIGNVPLVSPQSAPLMSLLLSNFLPSLLDMKVLT